MIKSGFGGARRWIHGRRLGAALHGTSHRLARLVVAAGLAFLLAGCGGAQRSADAPGAAQDLPASAPSEVRAQGEACDRGDITACNRVGIYLLVGGGGPDKRAQGLVHLRYACRHKHAPACRMLADLEVPLSP